MSEKEKTIETLKKEYEEVKAKIRAILKGKADRADLSEDERSSLRTNYSLASQYAKSLSDRCTNAEESEKYQAEYKKLSSRAASYGSNLHNNIPKTTFDDVKGLDEVKRLVKSFIFMAKNPDLLKYYKIEGGLGMLMYGAPGTGKTMFAEAIANAMNLPLFIVTPADIFKSYVGESEQAVKQLFQEIDACIDGAILFVDECESIFSKRSQDTKDYKAAVTTELLQRINGFGVNGSKRIMIAATNRPDVIDPAYLRYKRFSHLFHVLPPDEKAREAIITSKLEGIDLKDITIEEIVAMSKHVSKIDTGFRVEEIEDAFYSAADLCGIIEEASRQALEEIEENKLTDQIIYL